jgi:hypothetical protein
VGLEHRMLRFPPNLESSAEGKTWSPREVFPRWPGSGRDMLILLLLVFSSVSQDFDVPTSHLIGAHGYCTQVRGCYGVHIGKAG